jgi:hypothetical protein
VPINQITLAQLTSEILSIGVQLGNILNVQVFNFAADVVAIGTAGLQAAPYSLASADATLLFNACQDLDHFRQVYAGLMYVAAGATVNSGVPTANDGTHFGYNFGINVNQCDGLRF